MSFEECKTIDLRGQICPSTLLVALREVNSAKGKMKEESFCLRFLSDNRSSVTHINDAVSSMGYRVEVGKTDDYYSIQISRQVR